jgi:hypothetical protein
MSKLFDIAFGITLALSIVGGGFYLFWLDRMLLCH